MIADERPDEFDRPTTSIRTAFRDLDSYLAAEADATFDEGAGLRKLREAMLSVQLGETEPRPSATASTMPADRLPTTDTTDPEPHSHGPSDDEATDPPTRRHRIAAALRSAAWRLKSAPDNARSVLYLLMVCFAALTALAFSGQAVASGLLLFCLIPIVAYYLISDRGSSRT